MVCLSALLVFLWGAGTADGRRDVNMRPSPLSSTNEQQHWLPGSSETSAGRQLTFGGCNPTCFGQMCTYYTFSCAYLESVYDCDCSGCDECAPTTSPTAPPEPTAAPTSTFEPTVEPTWTQAPSASLIPSVTPTAAPTQSPTACFDFVMEDQFLDGWNGAEYRLRDAETNDVVAAGTLDDARIGTDVICLRGAGCYLLRVTSGSYPDEVSWSFGGTVTGGAPFGPANVWVVNGTLATGGACPTPSPTSRPTLIFAPTLAPTLTHVPSTTTPPSPNPTEVPSPSPTAAVYFQVDTFDDLEGAVQVQGAVINITTALIEMPRQLTIDKAVTIFSVCNATLSTDLLGCNRHFYLTDGSRLRLEGLILENGCINEPDGGGSIFAVSSVLEAFRCAFQSSRAFGSTEIEGGTIALTASSTGSFDHCRFGDSILKTVDTSHAFGGMVALSSSSTARFLKCEFENSKVDGLYTYGGTVALTSSSIAHFQNCRFDGSVVGWGETHRGTVSLTSSSTANFINCTFDISMATSAYDPGTGG